MKWVRTIMMSATSLPYVTHHQHQIEAVPNVRPRLDTCHRLKYYVTGTHALAIRR